MSAAGERSELSPEDLGRAFDWLDGELAPEDATRFELRLSAEPEVARRVEQLAALDDLLRRESGVHAARARPRSGNLRWILLAAASVAVALGLWRGLAPRAPAFEVALAPGFAVAEDWLAAEPSLSGLRAPGIGVARGTEPATASAEEFLRASAAAEARAADDALQSDRRELEAGWFVVPIELEAPSTVRIAGFPASGAGARLFPESAAPGAPAADGLVAAGQHLLPGARAARGAEPGTVAYRPGFLVPLGAGSMTVLVAVRAAEDAPEGGGAPSSELAELADLDGALARGDSPDAIAALLERQGFRTTRLQVREPR